MGDLHYSPANASHWNDHRDLDFFHILISSFHLQLTLSVVMQDMDSLLSVLKAIQLSITEIILQLETVTLSHVDVEKCHNSLKRSDIVQILSAIRELSQQYNNNDGTIQVYLRN